MKSYEFITETEIRPYQYSELEIAQAVKLLNEHCSDAVALVKTPIWRGMRNHTQKIIAIDPSTGLRRSTNTSNHYTELMDNSPYMKGWPKRSQSLVCSTNFSYAAWYGGLAYAIFPYNGVKIAVCPCKDLWATTINVPELGIKFSGDAAMEKFNNYVQNRLKLPEQYSEMVDRTNTPSYASWFSTVVQQSYKFTITKSSKIVPVLQRALSPSQAGFKLLTVQEFCNADLPNNEVWIGGPAIAIRKDLFEKFKDAIHKRDKLSNDNTNTIHQN